VPKKIPDTYTATFQLRPKTNDRAEVILASFAELMNRVERTLFADMSAGKSAAECKSAYIKEHKITARQFNSIRVQLEGKISSIKEVQKERVKTLKGQISALESFLKKRKKKNTPFVIHQKKRRLSSLKGRLKRIENDISLGKTRLCFGSKKLFRSQFDLSVNGYISHEGWKEEWRDSREKSFFLIGSKDEISGNQSVTALLQEDGDISLRIRLPDALGEHGKYLVIDNLHFAYGHEHIVAALTNKESPVAICYRFVQDKKGWRIFATLPIQKSSKVTRSGIGVIGVDINADHLAVVETDRSGNPIHHTRLELNTYGTSQGQAKALIGDTVKKLVDWSVKTQKPLVIEELSFKQKKCELREIGNPRYSRMLSSFAYNGISQFITSRSARCGVDCNEVNPAYTSVIGRAKFCKRYGVSIHESAALCIGRRYLGVSERLPRHVAQIADGKGGHVALTLPARNRARHVWTSWRQVKKRLPAALAAHFRAAKKRSSSQSNLACCDTKKVLDSIGGTPIRESTAELLGCRI
jgi:IS605 OrfB family transposase